MSEGGIGSIRTPEPRRRSNLEPMLEEGEAETPENSSRFNLTVDVHSKPGNGEEVDGAESWSLPRPDEVIDIEKKGDVVILVDEGSNRTHTAHSQTILEETKQSGVSFDASQGEVSFSTTSSQLTMQGNLSPVI